MPTTEHPPHDELEEALAGLDALDTAFQAPSRAGLVWSSIWPKLAAVGILILVWQTAVWAHWKPESVLPSPFTAFKELATVGKTGDFWKAIGITLQRAVEGYALSLAIGTIIGIAVSRIRVLRLAIGSFITGMQTMPSIAWFPIAILFFQISEGAILFVVILGAAPSIANGVISGIDHVPPPLLRTGKVLGASKVALYRHFIIPAALPTFVGGLKQGWSFAWRSLMAGELLVIVVGRPSLGQRLQFARDLADAPGLVAYMMVIFILGVLADAIFTQADIRIRRSRGLLAD